MKKKKVVLAYSGGLDTSVILKWLQSEKNLDVIAFVADVGQQDELELAKKNAIKMGAIKVLVVDLKNIFAKNFIFPMFRANTVYEGNYLLGTAIARPLIAQKQIEIAKKYKAYYVSHGATGKGNDQIRFELGYYAHNPKIKVIAPWREWDLNSRAKLINYANKNNIPVPGSKKKDPPYSMDANLLHISYEGKVLEDPWIEPDQNMFRMTKEPKLANKRGENIIITFEYIMLKDINDSMNDAKELIKLIRPFRAKINLIPFNPWPGSKYQVSSKEKIENFKNYILEKGKLVATIRTPRGEDVLAACGQLKSL